MNFQHLVLSAWMLQFSFAVHEYKKSGISLADNDAGVNKKTRSASHRRLLVKYETLIQYGAVVFSKPGVDTYSAMTIDATERKEWKEGIYVGARNWLFKFDMLLNETDAVEIPPSMDEIESCKKGNPVEECHNFIKNIFVVDTFATGRVDVCGTFAYTPACSVRVATKISGEISRVPGLSPGNPRGGTAAYHTGSHLFLGLVDPQTATSKILATTINNGAPVIHTVENKGWLNQAEFVGAFSTSKQDKFVYIVFREIAIEAPTDDVVFSRVARICKDDKGELDGVLHNVLASFVKARLDCGVEHSDVQSISYVENDPYFWATFTSDRNNGTAICGFSITALESVFRGPYLHRDDQSHEWEELSPPYLLEGDAIAETCFGFRTVEAVLNYTMMSNTVSHNCSAFVADAIRLNKIAVSSGKPGVFTAFAGDDLGRVWRIELSNCDVSGDVHVWEVVPANQSSRDINGLAIHNDSIIVLTHEAVLKILSQKEYPGENMEPSTSTATRSLLSPSSTPPAPRHPTKKTNNPKLSTTENPNDSHTQFEFSCSQTTISLIATAIMSL